MEAPQLNGFDALLKALFLLAIIGSIAAITGIIFGTIWLIHHVQIN